MYYVVIKYLQHKVFRFVFKKKPDLIQTELNSSSLNKYDFLYIYLPSLMMLSIALPRRVVSLSTTTSSSSGGVTYKGLDSELTPK